MKIKKACDRSGGSHVPHSSPVAAVAGAVVRAGGGARGEGLRRVARGKLLILLCLENFSLPDAQLVTIIDKAFKRGNFNTGCLVRGHLSPSPSPTKGGEYQMGFYHNICLECPICIQAFKGNRLSTTLSVNIKDES
jgi:hypothetical protein